MDRQDRFHADFWTGILADLNAKGRLRTVPTIVPLADWLDEPLKPRKRVLLKLIEEDTDVLILNWDVVNGDPDFGGDAALRWFEHRQFALRRWVNDGGVLIIESQAAQGVPADRYYAAILGEGELRVSGREDPRRPEAEGARMVGRCRMTRIARGAPEFLSLHEIDPRDDLDFDDLFPPKAAGRLVPRYLHNVNTGNLLYRGWFRRRIRHGSLAWVPYVRRDERWPLDFPTMLVAKSEKGAVFASTMLLSATRQTRLIQSMLLTHGDVENLPEPGVLRRAANRYVAKAAAGLLTALLLLVFTSADPVRRALFAAGIGLAVTVVLDLLPAAWRAAFRLVRRFTGA
ncbi:hypothetical protein ACI8AA_08940 [Geodermatophilus sp. SYSU D01180]